MKVEAFVGGVSVFVTGFSAGSMAGRKGDLAPSFVLDTEAAAGIERVLNYRTGPRNLELPLWFKAITKTELLDTVDDLVGSLAPGDITLRFTSDDNRVRELRGCYLKDGFGDDGFESIDNVMAAQAVLTFFCPDPYWYAVSLTTVNFVPTVSLGTFFPFFPLQLSANPTLQRQTVVNPGFTTWPVWTIYGPGQNLSLVDYTTGKSFVWYGVLGAADVLIIDTTPLVKTIEMNGLNAYAYLVKSSELFPLERGNNDLAIMMEDINNALTHATLKFYSRYISL